MSDRDALILTCEVQSMVSGERSCNLTLHQIKIYPIAVKCPFLPVLDRTLEPIKIFVSYARRDQELCAELIKHLKILKNQGWIQDWYDGQISAGSEWEKEIETHLNSAKIILLLISADFLASDYCYHKELMKALKRHDLQEASVIPIILRPIDWHEAPFGKLQALPDNALPVTKWENLDDAFLSVARGVRRKIEQLRREQQCKLEQLELERQQEENRRLQQIRAEQSKQKRKEQKQAILLCAQLSCVAISYSLTGFSTQMTIYPISMGIIYIPSSAWALAITLSLSLISTRVWLFGNARTWVDNLHDGYVQSLVGLAGAGSGLGVLILSLTWKIPPEIPRTYTVGILIWVWGAFGGLSWADASVRLLIFFNRFYAALILFSVSAIGLALGSLTYWITHR
jgi:hypothetical protein